MTFPATQLSVEYITRNLINSGARSWGGSSNKFALFTDTVNPTNNNDWQYGISPWNTGEVSGTGYTAGGVINGGATSFGNGSGLGTAFVHLRINAATWTNATFSSVRGGAYWQPGNSNSSAGSLVDVILIVVNFGADYAVSNGTFRVSWDTTPPHTGDGNAVTVYVASQP